MSIVMRIYIGMGAMIALILAVGGFAAIQTSALKGTFSEYRDAARTSSLANEMSADLF